MSLKVHCLQFVCSEPTVNVCVMKQERFKIPKLFHPVVSKYQVSNFSFLLSHFHLVFFTSWQFLLVESPQIAYCGGSS